MTIEALVINRLQDTARLARFRERAEASGWQVRRVPAADGHAPGFPFHAYADLIGTHFWGADEIKPGALGCFLSHRRAWQTVARNEAPWALVCEDDTALREGPDRLEAAASALGAFDLLFANDRMAGWVEKEAPITPLPAAVRRIAACGAPPKRAPGADAYLLTRRGAERLLAITARDRVGCGVDWAMVLAGADTGALSADEIASWSALSTLTENLGAGPAEIEAHVLAEPVAVMETGLPSVIEHGETVPIDALTARGHESLPVREIVTLTRGPARFTFAITAPKDPVQAALLAGEIPGEAAVAALIRALPDKGVLIDAGAGPGVASVLAGRTAERLLPVEADPATARLVSLNLAINGLGGAVDPAGLGVGLGASEGWARLAGPARKPSLRRLRPMEAESTDEPVKVVPGAALAGEAEVAGLIVDTGGGEFEVLRGFARLFRRTRPALLVTMAPGQQERIAEFLARFGYGPAAESFTAREGRITSLWH